jgi:hypothetical protein
MMSRLRRRSTSATRGSARLYADLVLLRREGWRVIRSGCGGWAVPAQWPAAPDAGTQARLSRHDAGRLRERTAGKERRNFGRQSGRRCASIRDPTQKYLRSARLALAADASPCRDGRSLLHERTVLVALQRGQWRLFQQSEILRSALLTLSVRFRTANDLGLQNFPPAQGGF